MSQNKLLEMLGEREGVWAAWGQEEVNKAQREVMFRREVPPSPAFLPALCVFAEGLNWGKPPVSSPVLWRGEAQHSCRGMLGDGERSWYPSPLGNSGCERMGELCAEGRAKPGGERPGKGRKGP